LSIVLRIAERHGAHITLGAGLDGKGLAVEIVLPPDCASHLTKLECE
jgi:two-component system sensor histidine kinase QseC